MQFVDFICDSFKVDFLLFVLFLKHMLKPIGQGEFTVKQSIQIFLIKNRR